MGHVLVLTGGLAASLSGQDPVWVRVGVQEGLPSGSVLSLLEDRKGFLWVGTFDGLARVSAEAVEPIRLPGPQVGQEVSRIFQGPDEALWAACADGPLVRVLGAEVRVWGEADGLKGSGFYALGEDPQGRLAVAGSEGFFLLEGGRFRRVPLPQSWGEEVPWAMARRGAELWCATRSGRLAVWDGTDFQDQARVPLGMVLDMAAGQDGQLWVINAEGIAWGDGRRWQVARELPFTPMGRLSGWAGASPLFAGVEGGIWERRGTVWQQVARPGEAKAITALRDRRGRLWVGTVGQGLRCLPGQGLTRLHRDTQGEDVGGIWSFLPEADTTWIGGERGLFAWREGESRLRKVPVPLPGPVLGFLRQGATLWVGTVNGLYRLRGGRAERVLAGQVSYVSALTPWNGGIAMATERGLVLLDGEGRFQRRVQGGPGRAFLNLVRVVDGQLLALGSQGIQRLEGDRLVAHDPQAPFGQSEVGPMARDAQGALWVAGVRGTFRKDSEGWRPFGFPWGSEPANIVALEVVKDRLVLGLSRGLAVKAGEQLSRLGPAQGFLGEAVNFNATAQDARGRVWIGAPDGAYRLDAPEALVPDHLPPPVILAGQGAAFPSRTTNLQFHFRTPAPLPPFRPRLQYAFGDEAWMDLGAQSHLTIPRLAPGSYRLRVRASTDDQHWEEGAPWRFEVIPAWYEHPATRGLAGLAGGLGLVAGWRRRNRALRRRNEHLEAEVARRTERLHQRNGDLEAAHGQVRQALDARVRQTRGVVHDLRGPLTSISLVVQRLETRVAPEEARMVDILRQESARLDGLLQQILDDARMEHLLPTLQLRPVHPFQVFEGLLDGLKVRAEAKGLSFTFEEAPGSQGVCILGDALALQQVLLNLVGNALKFTAQGSVEIHSWEDQGHWILEVRDTGRGMEPEAVERIFQPFSQTQAEDAAKGWGLGLSIVKGVVDQHRGVIEVDSLPGLGTVFRVRIPVAR